MQPKRKLSILFVESNPTILRLFPQMLEGRRDQWRMEFTETAAQGLELLTQSRFDVVVSGLHLPGINGLEFLAKVRDADSRIGRIIFSGHSDHRTVLESASVAHQFLPKPCRFEFLQAAIERAAVIRSLLPDVAMQEKISTMEHIPSIPSLYLELLHQLNSASTSIEDIARTASRDIEITAQILKTVNSTLFGLSQPTSNMAEAIGYLGVETVKYLALAAGLYSQFETKRLRGISLDEVWQHSLKTADAARRIAKAESSSRQLIEEASAAGMLHDFGKLVLAGNFPEQYDEVKKHTRANGVEWLVAEREIFGFDHADVGGYLLGLWGLSPSIVNAVAYHHFPTQDDSTSFTPLTAVHAANVLVQEQSKPGISLPQEDFLYLAKTGRTDALNSWRDELD